MSMHISAAPGEIAENVILPGDPLRAKYIAETYLTDAVRVNEIRNTWGYTGTYKGQRISVMSTGMGAPSMLIYATELCREYGCKKLLRLHLMEGAHCQPAARKQDFLHSSTSGRVMRGSTISISVPRPTVL